MSGKPAARIGDSVTCPKCGQTAIVTGGSSVIIENMPAATQTQGCACGSTITGAVIGNVLMEGQYRQPWQRGHQRRRHGDHWP